MITVSDEVKSLLQNNYRQLIKIHFPNGNDTIELTEADILQNSFRWDRYCATGDMLEIGTATSAEVEFSLINNGVFHTTAGAEVSVDDISFEGKELTIQIGIRKWGARRWENAQTYWFNIGKFTIMSMPHKFSVIQISALDRMTWFDLYVPQGDGENPFSATETLHSIIQKICNAVNISYSMSSALPNYDMTVNIDTLYAEEPQVTYRMLIQWVAALTGTCAYIDVDGVLTFRWLESAADVQLNSNQRYSSAVYEPVAFEGIVAEKNDQFLEIGSSSHYRFYISNNSLIQGEDWINKYQSAIQNVWDHVAMDPYRPFEASIVPMPYLEPLDMIRYKDNDGIVFDTIITHITFTLNGSTDISAAGISETEAQCVAPVGRTSRESADIQTLKNKIAVLENATAAARERLTGMFRMALGLHIIEVTPDTGGTIYYFTTADVPDTDATLADLEGVISPNDVIYQMSGAGLAWCRGSDWDVNSQAPNAEIGWRYGIAKDGSAVLGLINTEGINVSGVGTAYKTIITPESFSVYNGTDFVFGFNGQLESQINRLLVKANIEDPSLENNAYIRLGSAMLIPASGGLDIVYVEDINGQSAVT